MRGPIALVKLATVIPRPLTSPRCELSQLLLMAKKEDVNIVMSIAI